jgi:hypothetical protein
MISNLNQIKMKNFITFSMIILPVILFIDIIIMIIMGYVTSLFGFTNQFFELTYGIIAKFVFLISLAGYLFVALNVYLNSKNNALSIE